MQEPSSRRRHHHTGTARLRQRSRNGGADALPDYELLELVPPRPAAPRPEGSGQAPHRPLRLLRRGRQRAEGRLKEVSGVGEVAVTELNWCAPRRSGW